MASGGKQPGAGRPKGSVSELEKERLASLAYIKKRAIAATKQIMNAQIGLAVGSQYLFKIHKGDDKPTRVESQDEMEAYLRGDYEDSKHTFYFLTAKDPENKAIDSIFNRVHGRPTESLELKDPDGVLKKITVIKAK